VSEQLLSILVLSAVFLIATVLPVHMGALALVATFVVGFFIFGSADYADTIYGFFPGELFIILVGVTYLFAIAKNNGTVDWLVSAAVRASGGRLALIPWVMFAVAAALTAIGGVVPAVVAIIAPIGMAFARRYSINPVLMGLLIVNGCTAGGFSPLSIFGTITNSIVDSNGLPGSPGFLWFASIVANALLSVVVFFLFGGRKLLGSATRVSLGDGDAQGVGNRPGATLDRDRSLTLIGLVLLVIGALAFDVEIGVMAIAIGVILSIIAPAGAKGAVGQIAWETVLLICGIVTFVGLMQEIDTPGWLGANVAELAVPLIAALLICYIGGIVSAFASTTGILGALIPLAVPFLLGSDAVGAIGLVTALALSSSIVDSSPFSTSGALVVANSTAAERDEVFRTLMIWGFSMVALVPLLTWLVLVVPGWL
jgi:Na+/H+ antiporter NhaD/arsenite permease-like protein